MHTLQQLKQYEKDFIENGYFVLDLNNLEYVQEAANLIENHLKKISGISDITLKNYHQFFDSNDEHYEMQFQMLQFFRQNQFAQKILQSNLDVYQFLLGPDLEIQTEPYLRITRPFKSKDNIGFHRDTFYGTGPGEISSVIPFVDLTEKNSLSVSPKSHIIPDRLFKLKQVVNAEVPKDSKRHKMGFLYAPKLMDPTIRDQVVPVPLKKGQALVFMLSIVHGSEENQTDYPRWSTDIRVRNSLTPLNENMKANYYKPLKVSATAQTFEKLSV
ncbi:MAG: hypothetical protein S4CHLAM6_03550 [Chlamydiae bacterium]|nr:hypothetical protein [Chlamydiota bacterium]